MKKKLPSNLLYIVDFFSRGDAKKIHVVHFFKGTLRLLRIRGQQAPIDVSCTGFPSVAEQLRSNTSEVDLT